MAASEVELARLAMRLGELAAIRSEEYAAVYPEEIARRRLFFRRLLEECRRPRGVTVSPAEALIFLL
ncbi:MAG: hypothetical protein MJ132_03890 [Clostridia bacterium]|nr:hypothetical protein [Clostridia bacterium]